jgi:hypothetical protein
MVSVKVIDQKALYLGRGRWTMPLHMLKDSILIQKIQCLGRKLEQQIDDEQQRTLEVNPQVHFQTFKNEIAIIMRDRARVAVPKMNHKIKCLKEECRNLLNSQTTKIIKLSYLWN